MIPNAGANVTWALTLVFFPALRPGHVLELELPSGYTLQRAGDGSRCEVRAGREGNLVRPLLSA